MIMPILFPPSLINLTVVFNDDITSIYGNKVDLLSVRLERFAARLKELAQICAHGGLPNLKAVRIHSYRMSSAVGGYKEAFISDVGLSDLFVAISVDFRLETC
jgi:hypothetical protein